MAAAAGVLALLGLGLIGAAGLALRSLGSAWRVARVLGSTRELPLADAVSRNGRYVRTHGRIGSDEEFPDESNRPLVYRRTRVQHQDGKGAWTTLRDERLAVPFWVEERGLALAVDVDALGDGLVVVPRIAEGLASELPASLADDLGAPLPHDAPVRVRIDQISAVEHATVAGVVEGDASSARLTAGLGRPLILTTVSADAAMRLLASERRPRVVAAAALIVAGLGLLAMAAVSALLGLRP